MLTQQKILAVTEAQLALDMSCTVAELHTGDPVIHPDRQLAGRRIYDSDGCLFLCINWNDKLVAIAQPEFLPWCREHVPRLSARWLFEFEELRRIDRALAAYGHAIDDTHMYFLPDASAPRTEPRLPVVFYEQGDILRFRGDARFGEAFCFDPARPDVLAAAAMDGDTVMGMAGASADGKDMWQIGIDVLPAYRGRGIAKSLVALLKEEILRRGKVPFYGTGTSHIISQKTARSAGFVPAWVELFSCEKSREDLT